MTEAERLLTVADNLTAGAREIMLRKNHDYTSGSGDPYANFRGAQFLGIAPAVGICLRIQDKLQRIRTFAERGELRVDGEGLHDAVIDVINYAVLAYAVLTEDQAEPLHGVDLDVSSQSWAPGDVLEAEFDGVFDSDDGQDDEPRCPPHKWVGFQVEGGPPGVQCRICGMTAGS